MSESKRMPLEELRTTYEYTRLTSKQKLFIDTYCAGGLIDGNYDPVAATLIAYQCKSEEVARIRSYTALASINVVAVLNRHFGNQPIDSFLENLNRAVRNKKLTLAQLGALRLQCEVMGFATKLPGPGESFPNRPAKSNKKTQKTPKPQPPPATPEPVRYDPSKFQ